MPMNIYVHKDGTQYGPYSLEQIQQYIQQGTFTLQDLACHDGQNWVSLSQLPGLSAQPSVQPQQPQQAPQTGGNAQSKFDQSSAATTSGGSKNGKKKLIIWGSVGAVALLALIFILIFTLSGTSTDEDNQIAESDSETENSEGEEKSAEPAELDSNNNIPLIERIPSDAGAVILIEVNELLEKGRKDIATLLPPGLPPMVGKALKDPTSLGVDVSEPLQVHLIPQEDVNLAPTGGIAGKLSDNEKFMNTIELLAGLEKPTEKNGYFLYAPFGKSEPQIAVGPDFFFAGFADNPKDKEPSIDQFMTADGSDSIIKKQKTFAGLANETNDIAIWFGGDSILESLSNQMDNANLDTMKGVSGTLTLNFENGEMIGQAKIDTPKNEMVYGKGGFSNKILSFSPADAILSLGFALDLQKFINYAEKEILPEFGDDIKLDQPVDELGGLSIRDAINAFTGEFLISLTDVKMPDPSSMSSFPGGLGDPTDGGNPFGDADTGDGDIPLPTPGGFPGGGPGMNPGAMMMGAMPKPEFIVAASIDTPKWLKLKAAPPLAMGMGLAMMQGFSITEKNDFLLIASKDHMEATQSGSVKKPVSGSDKKIFENNDFVLKINVASILKLDFPIPPGGPEEMLKDISHLEMASNSGKTSGSGTMKLVFTNKSENSLSQILKMVKAVNTIVPEGMNF
jgi:hypothetical protein